MTNKADSDKNQDLPEDAQSRLRRLEASMSESLNRSADWLREVVATARPFTLNTSPDYFAQWLNNIAERLWGVEFPTDKGFFTISRIGRHVVQNVGGGVLQIEGNYHFKSVEPDVDRILYPGPLITFTVVPF